MPKKMFEAGKEYQLKSPLVIIWYEYGELILSENGYLGQGVVMTKMDVQALSEAKFLSCYKAMKDNNFNAEYKMTLKFPAGEKFLKIPDDDFDFKINCLSYWKHIDTGALIKIMHDTHVYEAFGVE